MKMLQLKTAAVLSVLALSLSSCSNYDSQPKNDAATGALLGAGIGAAVAGDGNRLGGAAIGAAVGGAGGYGVGKARE
jgi:hypothetical protein